MLTLAFSQLLYSVALKWRDVTGGSDGLGIPEKPGFLGFDLSHALPMYFMALFFFVLCFLGLRRLVSSPLGRVFIGIRENEARMLAIGYATRRYKLASFAIGGAVRRFRRRPLRHLQRLYLARRGLLERVGRRSHHGDAGRRRHAYRAGARRGRVPADEEPGQHLQRALALDHRRDLRRLRAIFPGRNLGHAAPVPDLARVKAPA